MFIVTALPRHRTAWLSVFLNCPHEALNDTNSIEDYINTIGKTGDSNTYAAVIMDVYPNNTKFIVIDGTLQRAIDYSIEKFNSSNDEIYQKLQEANNQINGLHIRFDEIDNRLKDIWDYAYPYTPFDKDRAEMLKKLEIKVKEPYPFNEGSVEILRRRLQCL